MPNGRSIVLERQPGTDPEGYAGLEDQVDNQRGVLFATGARPPSAAEDAFAVLPQDLEALIHRR